MYPTYLPSMSGPQFSYLIHSPLTGHGYPNVVFGPFAFIRNEYCYPSLQFFNYQIPSFTPLASWGENSFYSHGLTQKEPPRITFKSAPTEQSMDKDQQTKKSKDFELDWNQVFTELPPVFQKIAEYDMFPFAVGNALRKLQSILAVPICPTIYARLNAVVQEFVCSRQPVKFGPLEHSVCDCCGDGFLAPHSAEDIGKRPAMEDAHIVIEHLSALCLGTVDPDDCFFAVYDGHAGPEAAQYCREKLHFHLVQSEHFCTDLPSALADAFVSSNSALQELFEYIPTVQAGTTAIVGVIRARRVYVANVGDCRGVTYKKDSTWHALNRQHKPEDPYERALIESKGGYIRNVAGAWRVNGILSVSRSIGITPCHTVLCCEPEITVFDITQEDDFMVMGTDGLWDVLTEDEVKKIVVQATHKHTEANRMKFACAELIRVAGQRGSTDNVTVVVVDFAFV